MKLLQWFIASSLVSPPSPLQARETSGNTVINVMAMRHVMIKSLTHCMMSRFVTQSEKTA